MNDAGVKQDEWVVVHSSRDIVQLRELMLVLEACGLASRTMHVERTWLLLVPSASAGRARDELGAYLTENARPRGGERRIAKIASGWPGVGIYALVLVGVAALASIQALDMNWYVAGRADAEAIRAGQWWRVTTALMLHVDRGHLAGNIVFGGFFGFFVAQYCGLGIGWLAILLAGSVGNAINAFARPAAHLSIGASTAVFAALGILATLIWSRGYLRNTPWRTRFAPLFAAIALLAYTGTAGENTDLGAHLFGFIAGLGVGFAMPREAVLGSRRAQWIAGALAVAAVVSLWTVALAASAR